MDKFEKRLKTDAEAIEADVPDALRSRIDASLRGLKRPAPGDSIRRSQTRFWWASSLTGLAAAVLVIVLINTNRQDPATVPDDAVQTATVPPAATPEWRLETPDLDVRSAEFTGPLEEELERLKADFEKAREGVREDVDFTF